MSLLCKNICHDSGHSAVKIQYSNDHFSRFERDLPLLEVELMMDSKSRRGEERSGSLVRVICYRNT